MALNEIQFAERDPAKIEGHVITLAESLMSTEGAPPVKLHRADPRRLLLLPFIAMLVQQRNDIDWTAKQNLLYYALGDNLDHLGFFLGVTRLEPAHAMTTLRYELSAPQNQIVTLPAGTRATPDGTHYFATMETVGIPVGSTNAEVTAKCTMPGLSGNGWAIGQINQQVDRLPWVKSVANVTVSTGGAEVEDDENFRDRIRMAPESFSVAGPRGAYEYWARSTHQDIVDVAVIGPPDLKPGNVELYPLMRGGELPSQEIIDAVLKKCNAEDIRPLTDYVKALQPKPLRYRLDVVYWLDRSRATQAAALQQAVEAAARGWMSWQKSKLGRDLNPSELNHRMVAAGAKRVEVRSPSFVVLGASQVALLDGEARISFGGLEDG